MGRGTGRRKPFTLGGPEIIVAVADELTEEEREHIRRIVEGHAPAGVRVLLFPESSFTDPNAEADIWMGAYTKATPDCQKVLEYIEGAVMRIFEQDRRTGAVYRSGAQVWPSAPVAVACVGRKPHPLGGELSDWALLFADGVRIRITTIPDCFVEVRAFTTRPLAPGEAIPADWLDRARRHLRDA